MIEAPACPDPPGVDQYLREFAGGLAFDVGANVGQSAQVLARRFEKVVSCEPCWEAFVMLESLVVDGPLPNVVALPVAVSSHAGVVTLTENERHLAQGQLTSAVEDDPDDGAEGTWGRIVGHRQVASLTLDDLAVSYGDPDMVKIDVEGHEDKVVVGALGVLHRRKPGLWIEVHSEELGVKLHRMLDPVYGERLEVVRHPHYAVDSRPWLSHWWFLAR